MPNPCCHAPPIKEKKEACTLKYVNAFSNFCWLVVRAKLLIYTPDWVNQSACCSKASMCGLIHYTWILKIFEKVPQTTDDSVPRIRDTIQSLAVTFKFSPKGHFTSTPFHAVVQSTDFGYHLACQIACSQTVFLSVGEVTCWVGS